MQGQPRCDRYVCSAPHLGAPHSLHITHVKPIATRYATAPSHVIALPNTWRTAVPVPCAHYSSDLELQLFSWLCAPRSTKGNTSGTLAPLGLDEATARALIDAGLTVYASYLYVGYC